MRGDLRFATKSLNSLSVTGLNVVLETSLPRLAQANGEQPNRLSRFRQLPAAFQSDTRQENALPRKLVESSARRLGASSLALLTIVD